MHELGTYSGPYGRIDILEEKASGARYYYEAGVFQSYVRQSGQSGFVYVHLMRGLLRHAAHVLILGCGGGALATMLHQEGKCVMVVDHNPLSFELAREYFWMPPEIQCVTADFRGFLARNTQPFDGITVDVGGPRFWYTEEFDSLTCQALSRALDPRGGLAMNVVVQHDVDRTPDRIATALCRPGLNTSIIDLPGMVDRNAIIACGPQKRLASPPALVPSEFAMELASWVTRRPRIPARRSRTSAD